jgi:hypothetical protein
MPITSYLAIEQKVMKNLKNSPVFDDFEEWPDW